VINQNRGNNKIMKDKPEDLGFFAKLMAMIKQSVMAGEHRPSKHVARSVGQLTGDYTRKADAKKKRKRKIAYQSKRINRIRAK